MEKFAELYTRQNPDVFASADTAFILAFSVIMLNTDLHNPNIKPEKRMTIESFIRNNRGISVDGGDLPDAYLEGIFRRIESKPFTLKEDDDAREKEKKLSMRDTFFALQERNFFGTSADERKREKFKKEQEEIMSASEQLFKRRPKGLGKSLSSDDKSHHSQLTESVSPGDVVKPMFEVTWGPLIGTLSHVLETADDHGVINLCLNGFVYSVRIAANSNMSLARETFVNALTKFTTLGSIKEMKFKNIESIQTLLSIAIMDGEYLGESWGAVLQCISHLGRLQNMGSGGVDDDKFFIGEEGAPRDESKSLFRIQSKADVSLCWLLCIYVTFPCDDSLIVSILG
jgi:brefeldin A-inhibited guanine nucleotide-exchange protein